MNKLKQLLHRNREAFADLAGMVIFTTAFFWFLLFLKWFPWGAQ